MHRIHGRGQTKWDRYHYSLHYGATLDECFFRVDLDEVSGHHVHLQPQHNDHIPWDRVDPDVRNLDPRKFVEMVAKFREKKTIPIRRKKT